MQPLEPDQAGGIMQRKHVIVLKPGVYLIKVLWWNKGLCGTTNLQKARVFGTKSGATRCLRTSVHQDFPDAFAVPVKLEVDNG